MRIKSDTKFEEKLTFGLEIDMRNFANFHHSKFDCIKMRTLMGSFYSKQKMYELKIYRGVMYHDHEECIV